MSAIDQKEYLKKYLKLGKSSDKKKKKIKVKKPEKSAQSRVKIIDDDCDVDASNILDEDPFATNEDAPQIAAIIDERPPSMRVDDKTKDHLWQPIGSVSTVEEEEYKPVLGSGFKMAKIKSSGDVDASPPRRRRKSDSSPPRRKAQAESNNERVISEDNHSFQSVWIKAEPDDMSPPRRRRKPSHSDDSSPPRKKKQESTHVGQKGEYSPPRRRRDSDVSPPRRRKVDLDDNSPPRRKRRQSNSPPRRKRSESNTASSTRKSRWEADSNSPPRIKAEHGSSPPRRKARDEHISPPRKQRDRSEATGGSTSSSNGQKMKKTLDGKTAGLQNTKELLREGRELREREDRLFQEMSEELSGRNATTVLRDKKTSRIRDTEEEEKRKQKRNEEEEKQKEKYSRWGKGLAQVQSGEQKIQQELYEMSKPLARYADDEDLEKYLKEQERDGDPMLAYIRSKKRKEAATAGHVIKPQFEGEFMPNRYGIRPGHRWDGVDRSNGYEKKWFEVQNDKRSKLDEAYKWSTEDM